MHDVSDEDIAALIRDKYHGDPDHAALHGDLVRLTSGEPLAYVIGWIPFLGLALDLSSRPLIPRPETEYWTEQLITHLKERFGAQPFRLLDLCAGSGAIGLAVLKECPNARVTFAELMPAHIETIRTNLHRNVLDRNRAEVLQSDLFSVFTPAYHTHFDIIVTNPPYIPENRSLPESVSSYEPHEALFAGTDGLALIRVIIAEAPSYLTPDGELWMECDTSNINEAASLLRAQGARTADIHTDQYGRTRFLVAHW